MNGFHFTRERTPSRTRDRMSTALFCRAFSVRGLRTSLPILWAVCLALPGVGTAEPRTDERPVRVVNMLAERFFFVPSRLKVEQGTTVEFRIRSADTNHGFRIRKAGINIVVPKRGKGQATVIFHAKEKGRYDFECSKPCGAGHNIMRGTIIVE